MIDMQDRSASGQQSTEVTTHPATSADDMQNAGDGISREFSDVIDTTYHSYLGSSAQYNHQLGSAHGNGGIDMQQQIPSGPSSTPTNIDSVNQSLYHQAHMAAAAAQHQYMDSDYYARFGFTGVGAHRGWGGGNGMQQSALHGIIGHPMVGGDSLYDTPDLKSHGIIRKKGPRTEPIPQSGFKGVSWNSRMKAWLAFYVTENGERKSKTFSTRKLGMEEARLQAISFCREKQEQRRESRKRGAGVGNVMYEPYITA
eukprot:GHVO01027797.1.p1 GENE.GHVO01027797.1~~GHVO01027797.1.p1  ORF type:complete len:256 (-),score=37.62 GHVO01027797.1:655-1422(-)